MNNVSSGGTLISFIWKLLERISVQILQFLIQIVMARILVPEDYGEIALIIVVVNITNVLVQGGLNIALIQKKDSDILDFSSVLFFTLFLSTLAITVIWIVSPYLSILFDNKFLATGIRVYSIVILLNSIIALQNAIISKNMRFKLLFFASIFSTISYGFSGVYFAINSYGVWALIYSQILSLLVTILVLAISTKFIPVFRISFHRLKHLYKFSYKMLLSSLLVVLSDAINNYIIIDKYDSRVLGYYSRGSKIPILFSESFIGSISAVYLPVLSKIQDDKKLVLESIRNFITISSFVIFPVMFGLAIIAEPLVLVLLTDKWLGAVPFIQFFSMIYAFEPILAANYQVFAALGKSSYILMVELFKLLLYIVSVVVFADYGLYILLSAIVASSFAKFFLISILVNKLLGYSYKNQILDLLPNFLLSCIMGLVLFFMNLFNFEPFYVLIIQFVIGVFTYLTLGLLTKNKSLSLIFKSINKLINNK